jgi:cytochrome b561
MFIWRGFGWAVVVITFAALVLTELSVESTYSNEQYYQEHGWPKLFGFVMAAVLVWLLSDYLQKRPARVVIDKATGQEFRLGNAHDLFFVPLKYWPAILVLAGVAFLFG